MSQSRSLCRTISALAPHSKRSNLPSTHAAAVISGGKVLSMGYNTDAMTHCGRPQITRHAEIDALIKYLNIHKAGSDLMRLIGDSERCMHGRESGLSIKVGYQP